MNTTGPTLAACLAIAAAAGFICGRISKQPPADPYTAIAAPIAPRGDPAAPWNQPFPELDAIDRAAKPDQLTAAVLKLNQTISAHASLQLDALDDLERMLLATHQDLAAIADALGYRNATR